ncbi:hypothetical protein RP20_CCG011211 [Aedes albopictus]|nr:hypothetical protein RP20_CCG011211 [Aedes albopictus]
MDTFSDDLHQQTSRSLGSQNGNMGRDSPNGSSVSSYERDYAKCAFKPWVMIALLGLHCIASWAISITGIILIFKPFSENSSCYMFYLLIYLRAGYWFGTYKLNEEMKVPCRKLIDENYELYEGLTTYRKAPLLIVSLWNTALFVVIGYAKNFFDQTGLGNSAGSCKQPFDIDLFSSLQTPQTVIVIFCVTESLVLSCFYAVAVARLINASGGICAVQYSELQDHLNAKLQLRQQAETIKILQKQQAELKKQATSIGILEDK